MDKLTYNNVAAEIKVIHISPGGWEYIVEDHFIYPSPMSGKTEPKVVKDFLSKRPYNIKEAMDNYGYTREEVKDQNQRMREANKNLAKWKKGVRALIKIAKQGPGTFEKMGNAVHGNGAKNQIDYFWRLYRTISNEDLIEMGESGKTPCITSYVDGSYTYTL